MAIKIQFHTISSFLVWRNSGSSTDSIADELFANMVSDWLETKQNGGNLRESHNRVSQNMFRNWMQNAYSPASGWQAKQVQSLERWTKISDCQSIRNACRIDDRTTNTNGIEFNLNYIFWFVWTYEVIDFITVSIHFENSLTFIEIKIYICITIYEY